MLDTSIKDTVIDDCADPLEIPTCPECGHRCDAHRSTLWDHGSTGGLSRTVQCAVERTVEMEAGAVVGVCGCRRTF